MTTNSIIGFGALFQISDGLSPEGWTSLAETLDLSLPNFVRDALDTSDGLGPNEYREFIPGMKDGGEITVPLHFIPGESGYSTLETERGSTVLKRRRIMFPNGYYFPFYAFLTGLEAQIPLADRMVAVAKFKVSGEPGPLTNV